MCVCFLFFFCLFVFSKQINLKCDIHFYNLSTNHFPLLSLCLSFSLSLHCTQMSPFRDPLLKFALKFPSMSIDFFLCRLFDTNFSRIFGGMLRKEEGVPLREALAASPHKIITTTFSLCVRNHRHPWLCMS